MGTDYGRPESERCNSCKFAEVQQTANGPEILCHRYPDPAFRKLDYWCGEFVPIPAALKKRGRPKKGATGSDANR